jgi:hypothetical protein
VKICFPPGEAEIVNAAYLERLAYDAKEDTLQPEEFAEVTRYLKYTEIEGVQVGATEGEVDIEEDDDIEKQADLSLALAITQEDMMHMAATVGGFAARTTTAISELSLGLPAFLNESLVLRLDLGNKALQFATTLENCAETYRDIAASQTKPIQLHQDT